MGHNDLRAALSFGGITMSGYNVRVAVMRGAEEKEQEEITVPVLAKCRLDAACLAERFVNMTLDATRWARTKFVHDVFPPFPPMGPTAVAA